MNDRALAAYERNKLKEADRKRSQEDKLQKVSEEAEKQRERELEAATKKAEKDQRNREREEDKLEKRRLVPKDWLTIGISLGALTISLGTFSTLLKKEDHIKIMFEGQRYAVMRGMYSSLPNTENVYADWEAGDYNYTFINSGNRPAVISGGRVFVAQVDPDRKLAAPQSCRGRQEHAGKEFEFESFVIQPGQVFQKKLSLKADDPKSPAYYFSPRETTYAMLECINFQIVTPDEQNTSMNVLLSYWEGTIGEKIGEILYQHDPTKPLVLVHKTNWLGSW